MPDGVLPPVAPLTARSVVLNALLGVRPPALPVRTLVRVGGLFGIAERTTRVALTRMVADGDVASDDGVYRLTERLMRRRARLDEVRWPAVVAWDGTWEMAVVTATTRPQADRLALRKAMIEARRGELREGVWMRPRNTDRAVEPAAAAQCRFFVTSPDRPAELAATLWNLEAWASEARRLRARLDEPDRALAERFMLASEVLRHLVVDPLLPPDLQPPGWPADDLRRRYVEFEGAATADLRHHGGG